MFIRIINGAAIVVVVLILIFFLVAFLSNEEENSPKTDIWTSKANGSEVMQYLEGMIVGAREPLVPMTGEQCNTLFHQRLRPVINRVIDAYPLPTVRQEFIRAITEIRRGGKYELALNGSSDTVSWAFVRRDDGEVAFFLNMPHWARFLTELDSMADQEKAMRRLEDKLIETFTHEHCHLDRQTIVGFASDEELVIDEAECWAYSSARVIQPMIEAGRGPNVSATSHALNHIYQSQNYTKDDTGWHDAIRRLALKSSLH